MRPLLFPPTDRRPTADRVPAGFRLGAGVRRLPADHPAPDQTMPYQQRHGRQQAPPLERFTP
jgi:hypothetical protein